MKPVIKQTTKYTTIGEAEDAYAGIQTIPGYVTGFITEEKNHFTIISIFDIEGEPVKGQRRAYINNTKKTL